MALPLGLQLYTVRDVLQKDPAAGLAQVAQMGFHYVELAGLYGKPATEIRDLLAQNKLTPLSAHVGLDNLPGVIADAKTIGYKTVVLPWWPQEKRTLAGYKGLVELLSKAGKELASAGLSLAYHNHDFEFHKLEGGITPYEMLIKETDPNLVKFEMDAYWVWYANQCPHEYIKKLGARLPLLHVKDLAKDTRKMTEVGTGIIDYPLYVKTAPMCGVQAFIIEQDNSWIDNDPMKSAALSLQNFLKMPGTK